jgi:hypothetical protein
MPPRCVCFLLDLRKVYNWRIGSWDCSMLQGRTSLQTNSMVSSVHSTSKASAKDLSAQNNKKGTWCSEFSPIVQGCQRWTIHPHNFFKENDHYKSSLQHMLMVNYRTSTTVSMYVYELLLVMQITVTRRISDCWFCKEEVLKLKQKIIQCRSWICSISGITLSSNMCIPTLCEND